MADIKTINFITGNKNKLAEVEALIGDVVELQNRSIDIPEIQGTIEEIAKEKCRRAADAVCTREHPYIYICLIYPTRSGFLFYSTTNRPRSSGR